MTEHQFTPDESRKLAVFIARVWADSNLEAQYKSSPDAVLAGAGIALGNRPAPEIPERPSALSGQGVGLASATSSASSASTITCPCSACTASSAGCLAEQNVDLMLDRQIDAMMKLAQDPKGREDARKLTTAWGLNIQVSTQRTP